MQMYFKIFENLLICKYRQISIFIENWENKSAEFQNWNLRLSILIYKNNEKSKNNDLNDFFFFSRKSNKIMKWFDGISFMKENIYALLRRCASFEVVPAIYFCLFICISPTISSFIACDYLFIWKKKKTL